MITFLYGPDAYRLQKNKQNIINEYRKKHSSGINIFNLDLSDANNLGRLLEALKSSSFFNEHKLVTLSGSFSKKIIADEVGKMINCHDITSDPGITLLFTEPDNKKDLLTKSGALFNLITGKNNIVKTFNLLT